ncbi:MAG: hypothetical protein DWQ37_07245 [Planctomycetota bacterium]|nr:MAG: hypothetical protein DWQ37_07245 [Planctomycetota bacterium]
MPAKRSAWLVVGALAVIVSGGWASAAPPWSKLFKQLEADPHQLYPITDANGPWLITAATFSGEGAEEQARKLIYELRKEYKLPAYSYQRKFEYSKPVRGKGLTPKGEAPLMRYNRGEDVVEIAVMVGDFPTVDDPEGQRILKKLKSARPKTLEVDPKQSNQALATYRRWQQQAKQKLFKDDESLQKGPMGGAFMVANPILPREYFVPKGVDKLVVEMNSQVPHSLLDCPEPYTVKVATFTGHAVILDAKCQEAIDRGEMPKSYLEEAAKNAHLLTEALRRKGYEAYEFHDRHSSIVTVGSFTTVGSKRPDGKIEINPRIHAIMKTFGPETTIEPGKPPQIGKPKKLAGIPFDIQPVPVEVPRMSISNTYERTSGAVADRAFGR